MYPVCLGSYHVRIGTTNHVLGIFQNAAPCVDLATYLNIEENWNPGV